MKKGDRDNIDDLFRSKLYDFEVETAPEDWDAIEKRLTRPSIPFYRKYKYQWMAAAAVAALLVLSFGIPWNRQEEELVKIAQEVKQEAEKQMNDKEWVAAVTENQESVAEEEKKTKQRSLRPRLLSVNARTNNVPAVKASSEVPVEEEVTDDSHEDNIEEQDEASSVVQAEEQIIEEVQPVQTRTVVDKEEKPTKAEPKPRKWGFGMGAGSLSAGNNSSVNAFALRSSAVTNEYLSLMNASSFEQLPKTDVKHKMPLSFGLSASRYLTDRWSLQAGLSYSYLVSEWTTNKTYRAESEQRLHFLGVPVAVTYKIAEWNRFMFYASAGGQVELNVAGKVCTDLYSPVEKLKSVTEKERMKEPYFSVNARVGVSYPIIRFLSAYAEVGADYYFDNGSDVETIHSEKPFYVGLQLGFRFGF